MIQLIGFFFPSGCYNETYFVKLGFTPCKAEQPFQGMEVQEKEA